MIAAWMLLAAGATSDIVVLRPATDRDVEARRPPGNDYPVARGFRARMLEAAGDDWPDTPRLRGGSDAILDPKGLAEAATLVSKRIARDGLLPTLVRVVDLMGASSFEQDDQLDRLRRAGIPIDWLSYFQALSSTSVVHHVAQLLASGVPVDDVIAGLGAVTYAFRPTLSGFQVATESGENDIACLRLQIGSWTDTAAELDGSPIDIARSLATQVEGVEFVAGIQAVNVERFLALARAWKLAPGSSFTLVSQERPISSWAGENGKPGFVDVDGSRTVVTLVPRYASRGEEGAFFLTGDTFALEAFASTGRRVVQSPLLFQGGNLIPVLDPKTMKRQLLVGEAEIARNRALGLDQAQVLEAFRTEFGVERCLVLPATSFHIDSEVTVRSTADGLVAFMNDTSAATRIAIRCGLPALERAGALSAEGRKLAEEDMGAQRWEVLLQRIGDALSSPDVAYGIFPESLAEKFSSGPRDSGTGNLQRFLLALDTLVAERNNEGQLAQQELEPHLVAYLLSMRRREAERLHVAQVLTREGFRIVGVPSTSEGRRSLNTLGGVHARGVYYMPAYGGLYAEFDRAAQAIFEANLGSGVRVVPVPCGESLRRDGVLHSAVSVLPRP